MPAIQPRSRPLVVAIDGPSGSGKSSVSREVARRLGLEYLDTGAMYRAVCWSCLENGVPLDDRHAVGEHVRGIELVVGTDPAVPTIKVGEQDVTGAIRAGEISAAVSRVATNQEVRTELRRQQRQIIERAATGPAGGCVAEGRDITTVVAPHADVRVLLTASETARLQRRARELHGSADENAVAATRDQVVRRDADDSTVSDFLTAADGVVEIDTSGLNFEGSVSAVLRAISAVLGPHVDLGNHEPAAVRP